MPSSNPCFKPSGARTAAARSVAFCGRFRLVLCGALALVGCSSSTDSIGHDQDVTVPVVTPPPPSLLPLRGPDAYQNPLHDQLKITDDAIDGRIDDVFNQLFHSEKANESIYFAQGDDEAYIKDTYHDDVRTEGVGLAMLITVELGKREEFDKLWTYAKRELAYATGSNAGYFRSYCDAEEGSVVCIDPYGAQQFVMALIFAHDVWPVEQIDYGADALAILDVMLHKEAQNGGIIDDVTDTFDAETMLVFDEPKRTAASRTRPSILMPAYYELWAQATGNPFFQSAAEAARKFFPSVVNQKTGLLPLRAYFDGTPVPGGDIFTPEAYRALPNLVLDEIWTPGGTWNVTEFDRVLSFFVDKGLTVTHTSYELDGTPVDASKQDALAVVKGIVALASTSPHRNEFIQAVFDLKTPTDDARYYTGLLQLFALLALSGRMQVL